MANFVDRIEDLSDWVFSGKTYYYGPTDPHRCAICQRSFHHGYLLNRKTGNRDTALVGVECAHKVDYPDDNVTSIPKRLLVARQDVALLKDAKRRFSIKQILNIIEVLDAGALNDASDKVDFLRRAAGIVRAGQQLSMAQIAYLYSLAEESNIQLPPDLLPIDMRTRTSQESIQRLKDFSFEYFMKAIHPSRHDTAKTIRSGRFLRDLNG